MLGWGGMGMQDIRVYNTGDRSISPELALETVEETNAERVCRVLVISQHWETKRLPESPGSTRI